MPSMVAFVVKKKYQHDERFRARAGWTGECDVTAVRYQAKPLIKKWSRGHKREKKERSFRDETKCEWVRGMGGALRLSYRCSCNINYTGETYGPFRRPLFMEYSYKSG